MVTRILSPHEVPFDTDVAHRFLKIRRTSEKLQDLVRDVYGKYRSLTAPCFRYDVLRITGRDIAGASVTVQGEVPFTGAGVFRQLERAVFAVPFVLTLGGRIDEAMAELSRDDFTEAYFLDGVASAMTEGVLEVMKEELDGRARELDCVLGYRYAPGYARWPLAEQKQIFLLLKPEEIGMRLTDTSYMIPQKSLSGVFNLDPHVTQQLKGI